MPCDLFSSYSRRDNAQDRITHLAEGIKADFAPFAKRELVAFFDQDEIHGMSDWRQRILQGLRESRLLLACLSPAYLQSEYCDWEFVEYRRACLKTRRDAVFVPEAGWHGATRENTPSGSSTEEQRPQPALGAKTLRAAGLLSRGCVVAYATAHCGDARPAPPCPRPKSLAAAPRPIFRLAHIRNRPPAQPLARVRPSSAQ